MEATAENPCHQFFIGLPPFSVKCPFTYSTLALFRRRTTAEMPMAANESFLKDSPSTPEHRDAQPGWGKAAPAPEAGADGVAGTLVLDAACPPVDIRFPQDFSLLDEAREKTDGIIDVLHRQVAEKGERHPRTCREALRKAHLGMAKARRRPANKMRALVRRLLLALARNPGFIEALLARGGRPTGRQARMLDAIGGLRRRQKEMSDGHRHRVGGRMVGISHPWCGARPNPRWNSDRSTMSASAVCTWDRPRREANGRGSRQLARQSLHLAEGRHLNQQTLNNNPPLVGPCCAWAYPPCSPCARLAGPSVLSVFPPPCTTCFRVYAFWKWI